MSTDQEIVLRPLQEYATVPGVTYKDGVLTCSSVAFPAIFALGGGALFFIITGMMLWYNHTLIQTTPPAQRIIYELSPMEFTYYTTERAGGVVMKQRHSIPWNTIRDIRHAHGIDGHNDSVCIAYACSEDNVSYGKGYLALDNETYVATKERAANNVLPRNKLLTFTDETYIAVDAHRLQELMSLCCAGATWHKVIAALHGDMRGVELVGNRILIFRDYRAGFYMPWLAILLALLALGLLFRLGIVLTIGASRKLVEIDATGIRFYNHAIFLLGTPTVATFAWHDIRALEVARNDDDAQRKITSFTLSYLDNDRTLDWQYTKSTCMPMPTETLTEIIRAQMTGPAMPPKISLWQQFKTGLTT